jgi:hypothetical protein
MTREQMVEHMSNLFVDCREMNVQGQKEYAHDENNAFANFERIAESLTLDRKEIVMVYLLKHIDGISSHVGGFKSQRESVHGRIMDAIVYLAILDGMFTEEIHIPQEEDIPF